MATSIVTYNDPESNISLDLPLDIDAKTTWVNQRQLADILGIDQSVVSRHITNFKKERGERANRDYANFALTASDGKTYNVEHYSVTIAVYVGFRAQATKRVLAFQDWVGKIIEDRIQMTKSKALTPAELFAVQAKINLDHERQLTDHDHRIAQLESGQIAEYFTVLGYFVHRGLPPPMKDVASRLGKQAKALSDNLGYEVKKVPDERYGEVGSYHQDILKQIVR